MLIIPAIDLKNGNCVRLLQGDPEKETVYSTNPREMAKSFEDMGAQLIHVVDLDGAFEGRPVNFDLVASIARAVKIPIEIGGGIRSGETVRRYLDAGIGRIILGSVILEDEFDNLLADHKESLVAGIDAKNSMVAVKGWKDVTSVSADEIITKVMDRGIGEIIYTDISTDGMLSGPNMGAYEHILETFPGIRLIASGGVSCLEDLAALSRLEEKGLRGAIVGKAIYDGRIDLRRALKEIH
ncbi:MAG: 1-(5-phosphoribosyl)-5-[(5-phosphoribosylamino)methylideneamino]imidazole-4-carboxamide isomerase [Spirochaetae bacterium HGW-Spirochaetae-1]|jgi:phosphoribosylformimino-5-aminoimidazole carboxamide ribotide isomerase|nr:MAG: 1-(5-phosphoribosyl)-5-[(5-phosphoribosylamino)methylideneamino]imidazole-4-carboxamide isomerase [Spirochaetae bacterium HGW-Spirochaetae-1]